MSLDKYFIEPAGDQWLVRLNASTLCTFTKKADAIRAAVEAARQSGEIGIASAVVSASEEGHFTPIWIFGRDEYSAEA